MRRAVIEEPFAISSVIHGERLGVASHFQRRIHRLQCPRGFFIERIKLFRRARPEKFRLVPEFPIANVVMKAIPPSLVVMHGDVLHHIGKLIEICGRLSIAAKAPSHAVINFALRLFRIGAPIRKNDARIPRHHQLGALLRDRHQPFQQWIVIHEFGIEFGRPHEIVRPHEINVQIFILIDQAGQALHDRCWLPVHPLEGSDLAGYLARVYVQRPQLCCRRD